MAKVSSKVVWNDEIATAANKELTFVADATGVSGTERPLWKRTLRRFTGRERREQKAALAGLADATVQINHNVHALHGALDLSDQRLQDMVRGFESISVALDRLYNEDRLLRGHFNEVAKKVDDFAALLAEHTESIVQLQRGIVGPSGDLRALERLVEIEHTAQQLVKNLDYLRDEAHLVTANTSKSRDTGQAEEEPALGPAMYAKFEDEFRGSRDEIRSRLSDYIPIVDELVNSELPILDIGCGRGEWLQLLADKGIRAYGVDMNEEFVELNKKEDLDVILGDAIEHMNSLEANSLRMVTAFHLVEHLPRAMFRNILAASYHALAPGGAILFETPNPGNVSVGAGSFYLDPTHLRPVPAEYARFLTDTVGFQNIRVIYSHPRAELSFDAIRDLPASSRRVVEQMWTAINGPQDYAILGFK